MKLSEHFDLYEFTYSDTALKYNIKNEPSEIHLKTLKHTCEYFLEPLRKLLCEYYIKGDVIKLAVNITSGYRSKLLNDTLKKAGYNPSTTSQHCTGEACDFEVVLTHKDGSKHKVVYTELYYLIKLWVGIGKISVDQCICEKQGSMVWIHCSHSASGRTKDRKQFMKYLNGKYIND